MARVFPKPDHPGIRSTVHKYLTLDYVPWQRSPPKSKPSPLPPVQQASKKGKLKGLINVQPGQVRSQRELRRKEKLDPGKMQTAIRLTRMILRHRQTSLQELRRHEDFLLKLNQDLVKTIQDMEDSTALKVRKMLQQQSILGTVINILEHSNKERLQDLTRELQEWEEKEETKMNNLKQQVEQLNAKIKKIHEEVSFLSTYMDHEYPVRSVQIANLARQLQQLKDSQQDELEDLNEMRRMVLATLSSKIQRKKINLLKSLVVKAQQPHQEALVQKIRDNQDLVKCMDKFRAFIDQFQEEIPILKAEVEELQAQLLKPREIIFKDVLLQRPKYQGLKLEPHTWDVGAQPLELRLLL
ncbi:uncharacterized protein C20orf96 homolog isoform X1 [Dasypus novemcinctus]|uniref:uncharacterized protein C20orf96 homolog isoform X1 n=1 Tax=Dasypus novemcinctus TaxID=9361 RepID=UPI00265EF342|nr:uncharacterized protein C20orf96 homolog isoform X2 [Dasypus novemcinctus]